MSAIERLSNILAESRTLDSSHTHVMLGPPYGKVNIGSMRQKDFWDAYLEIDSQNVYLAEKPLDELPVLVDIDLKTRVVPELKGKIYSDEQVKTVVRAYQSTLKDKVVSNLPDSAVTCVLLEKDPYIINLNGVVYVKNGFHLHFPKLFIDKNVHDAYVIPIVKKEVAGLFDNLYTIDDGNEQVKKGVNNYDFIDEGCTKVHWLLYGSRKPNSTPYVATKCFLNGCVEVSFEEALGDYVLPKLQGETKIQSCQNKVRELLPRILSTRLQGRQDLYYYKAKPSIQTPIFQSLSLAKTKRKDFEQRNVEGDMEKAIELMKLISDVRADDRKDWLYIGFCLWSISRGDVEGLYTWLEFSDRSQKFNEAECICMWNNMRENNYTLATLKFYAKQDNPKAYEDICKRNGDILINKAVEGGHSDMAKIMHNEYGGEFCYSLPNSMWYRFTNHIWKKYKICYDLSERISDSNGAIISHLTEHLKNSKYELQRLNVDSNARPKKDEDDEEIRIFKNKITTLSKLIKQCKIAHFKQSVMKECQEVFRNDSFVYKLNMNPHLIAFKNGIYDFKNNCFRDGNPEDFLSECLPIEYKDYGTIDHPDVMEVSEFFRKVLPDEDVRKYFLDQACQLFVGGNHDKIILIWTGSGDNGKTVTQKFFEKMLGPLAVKISTSLITGKKTQMGAASPELARTGNGVRWVVMDEPNQDEQITTGLLKSITGNDSYWARDLYQGGSDTKEIVPLYKIHMLCNKLPSIRNPDDAFWERVRVIPFESKFIAPEACPHSYEEQMAKKLFPKDQHFSERIDSLLQPLVFFLICHWRQFNRKDRVVPEKVKIATGEYRDENSDNPHQDFFDEELILSEQDEVNVAELYTKYKEWYRTNYPGEKVELKKVFTSGFAKLIGKDSSSRKWKGIGWKPTEYAEVFSHRFN